jgi:hypothetical protein
VTRRRWPRPILAIAPLGFLIGFLARPHGASAIALLILFPLSLASGVFMPVEQLPGVADIALRSADLRKMEEGARRRGNGHGLVQHVLCLGKLAGLEEEFGGAGVVASLLARLEFCAQSTRKAFASR